MTCHSRLSSACPLVFPIVFPSSQPSADCGRDRRVHLRVEPPRELADNRRQWIAPKPNRHILQVLCLIVGIQHSKDGEVVRCKSQGDRSVLPSNSPEGSSQVVPESTQAILGCACTNKNRFRDQFDSMTIQVERNLEWIVAGMDGCMVRSKPLRTVQEFLCEAEHADRKASP